MPFNELQRRDSWPPTIVRLHNDEDRDEISEIDDDPFSFFLTSPQDLDIDLDLDDEEDLSAGIETSAKPRPVRSISPSQIQKYSPPPSTTTSNDAKNQDENEDDDNEEPFEIALALPLSLKDFSRAHTIDGRASRSSLRPDHELTGLGIQFPTRGRPTLRGRGGRGSGQTRSLSARRPRSWRLPSPDLGSITEERESEEDEMPIPEISASAPTTGVVVQVPMLAEGEKKKKKRVHWAF